jgi:uncharacterized cupredoxin-like copper-binding protein
MNRPFWKRVRTVGFWAGLLAIWGCASLQAPFQVNTSEEGQEVFVTADDHTFSPNNIQIEKPGSLTLKVENVSDKTHNITLKNPQGDILKSVDLPPKRTIPLTVDLPGTGKYEFYCDKPFHPTLGMVGQIVVGGPPP